MINGVNIIWKEQIDYLGVQINSAKHFVINLQRQRQKFFAALNSIFSKVGLNSSPSVIISLVESYCTPILLYASECVPLTKSALDTLEKSMLQAYFKIFRTFDKSVALQCMYYMGQLPLEMKISIRKINFLTKLSKSNSLSLIAIFKSDNEIKEILTKFKIDSRSDLRQQFQSIFKQNLCIV